MGHQSGMKSLNATTPAMTTDATENKLQPPNSQQYLPTLDKKSGSGDSDINGVNGGGLQFEAYSAAQLALTLTLVRMV